MNRLGHGCQVPAGKPALTRVHVAVGHVQQMLLRDHDLAVVRSDLLDDSDVARRSALRVVRRHAALR
jgi:hypothetical protein